MDPDAPINVVIGTLATGSVTTAYAALIATAQSQNPFAFAINGAIGGGVVGLTYFGLKNYLISPLLITFLPFEPYTLQSQILSQKRSLLIRHLAPQISSLELERIKQLKQRLEGEKGLIRWEGVLDSGLAGGVTGGCVGWWAGKYRGMKITIPRSAIQLAAITSALQFGYNTVRILRLDYLGSRAESIPDTSSANLASTEGGKDGLVLGQKTLGDVMEAEKKHWPLQNEAEGLVLPSSTSTSSTTIPTSKNSSISKIEHPIPAWTTSPPPSPQSTSSPSEPLTLFSRLTTYLTSISPIRSLPNEEYHSILLSQRQELLAQLDRARSLTSEERRMKEKEEEGWSGFGVGRGNGESEIERQLDMVRGKLEGLEERMRGQGK